MIDIAAAHYLQPDEVVKMAMALYQPDGTIRMYDVETGARYNRHSRSPINVAALPADRYAARLIELARNIAGTISHIGVHAQLDPLRAEASVQQLAVTLSSYLNDPHFIENAIDLIQVSGTSMQLPSLPDGSPWRWVPEMRAGLHSSTGANQ